MARGGFQNILDVIRANKEREQNRADIESIAPAILNSLGINPAQDLPFNEQTFFDEEPVSRGTNIGQIIETPGLEDGQPAPTFEGADDRRGDQRTGQIVFTPDQRKAFGRFLSRNPPQASKLIIKALEQTRPNQILELQKQTNAITKDNVFLQGAKTPLELLGRIRQLASEPGISQARKTELREILANPDFEGKKLLIEKNILDGKDLKTIFEEKEQRRQEKATKAKETPFGKIDPSDFTVESLGKFQQSGKFSDLAAVGTKADSPFAKIDITKFTPASVEKFRTSKKFSDLKTLDNSAFAKPNMKDFTQASVKKFMQSKKPGDLVAVDKGPSDQILSAFIPFMFGGVDFESPEEMAQAFSRFNMIGAGLAGKGPEELQRLAEQIKDLAPKEDVTPQDPSALQKIGAFFKSFFKDNDPASQAVDEVIQDSITKQPRSVPQAAADVVPLAQIQEQIPGVEIDEFGFAFLPNPSAPGGKQFITDKRGQGGKRIRVK